MATPFETILNIGKNIVKTGKQAVTDAYSGTGAFAPDTGLGIARNTVLGTPKAFGTVANTAKEFLASNRGFELDSFMDYQKKLVSAKTSADKLIVKQNWQAQQPTFTESTKTPFKIGAEIASGLGNLAGETVGNKPLYTKDSFLGRIAPSSAGKTLSDVAQTRVGGDLANLGKSIESFATPKTAGQAQAMRLADVLSFFPMGTAKAVTKLPQTIKLARNTAVFDHLPVIEKALNEAQLVGKNIDLDALETIEKIKNYKINDLTDSDVKGVYEILARNGRQDIVESISKQISETPELRPAAPSKTELADQAKAIVKDGKKAVTEVPQPRDTIGRFDVKPKPSLSDELMSKVSKGKGTQEAFGAVAGVEVDENGNVKFDPLKAGLGFAGFTAFNRMKKIMPVDRLIAEGKIKINRVGTRDVYSYKKGNIWQRARDEDSAVRAVTKEPKAKPSLPENLVEKKISVEIAKEAIRDNPLNGLIKYTAKRGEFKGRLPEVLGGAGTKGFRQKGDDIIQSITGRNIDSETARQELENFMERKQQVLAQEKAVNAEIKAFRASQTELKTKATPKAEAPRPSSPIQAITGSTGEIRSLEKMAEQSATKEILDPQLRKSSSLPKIIEKSTTNVKNKVNALDYLRTPDKVLKKIGLEKNADEIRRGYDAYVKELPKNIDKITEWSKRVSEEGNTKIFKYLDGEAIDLNPEELKVANEIKVYLSEWANRLGLPQDNRIANYITHLFDDQLIAKEFDEDLAKIIADKVPSSVYDPFLLKRLGAKGYKQDTWAALDAYVKRGTRKVHMDAPLANLEDASRGLEESQWNYVKRFADRVNMRPTEFDNLIDNGIKSFIGYRLGQRPVTTISRTLRQATYRGMLGLNVGSALRNLSQGINTYAKLGEKYTVIGYSKLFSPKNLAELTEEGVLSANFVQDRAMSSTKKFMERNDKVLFSMFQTSEKINRGAAYFGAKAKGIAEGMTEAKAIEYAKKTVRDTQFAFGSIDTPVGMSSDIVKTLTQFQTFTTKQIEFLAKMAKNKEYAGLIRYALSGIAFVYTVGQAFGMEPKDLAPIYRLGIPPSLKLPWEGVKAIAGAKDKYGNERTTGEKVQDVAGTLPGYIPAGIQAKKTIQGVQSIREGGVFDRANRLQFEGPQTKAQQIQAILFGKYASQKAKDYFNEADGKELDKIRPVYDQVQKLKEAGDIESGQQVIDSLTDEEYEMYKKVKSSETTKKNAEIKKSMYPVFNNVQKLKASNRIDEAQKIIDGLTDDEYKAYQSIKKDNDNKPTTYDQSLVSRYAEAVVKDPSNALKALFTDEKLGKVEGNLVELQRFYGIKFTDKGGSQEYKQKRMQEMGLDWDKEKGNYKLEHIVPVSAGGDNSDSNLIPVNNTEHDVYTPVDIALGEAVKQGKITRKKATELAYGLKVSKVLSVEDIIKQLK